MPTENDYQPFEATPAAPDTSGSTGEAEHGGRQAVTIVKPAPAKKGLTEEDYAPYDSKDAAVTPPPYREVGAGEAAAHGYMDIGSFGLVPAIAGATAAGTAPGGTGIPDAMAGVASEAPGGEAIGEGLSRLWHDHFGDHPDPAAREAYTQGREAVLNDQNLAYDQHFWPYLAGQVGGALSMPGTIGRAAFTGFFGKVLPRLTEGAAGRIGGAALTGGTMTAAQSAGKAVSEGRPEDIPAEAGKGFVTGGVMGGAAGVVGQAAKGIASKVGTVFRGNRALTDPEELDALAGKQVVDALRGDAERFGASMTPEQNAAARTAGTEKVPVDYGGERSRALLRSAVNKSPEGRQAAQDVLQRRFEQESSRVAGFVRRTFGNVSSSEEMDRIAAHKASINPGMYKHAYTVGDRPIWSNEIERLTGDPDVQSAIGKAIKTGKSWAILDGMGGFNPSVRVTEDGQLIFNKGPTGVPTYPNIQFWDYVQRELNGKINVAKRANETSDITRLSGLRDLLVKDLDAQVPEFAQARTTASTFFKATNAVEAGENFVMGDFDHYTAQKMVGKYTPAEQKLFAQSFASEFARKVEAIPDNQEIVNKAFINSVAARQKIELALGPQGTNQMEAMLRSEIILDKARKALGNSTTARQMAEMGMAGGAVTAMESLKHMTMFGAIAGALTVGTGVKKGIEHMSKIDENISRRIAEMLVDPEALRRGVQAMAASPTLLARLRQATGAGVGRLGSAGVRMGAPDVGFTNLAAGATVGAEDIADLFKKEHKEPHKETETLQYQDATQ